MENIINSEYVKVNLERAERWHVGGIVEWSPADWMTATVGELGELANVLKKIKRHDDGLPGNTLDVEQLWCEAIREWADTFAYLLLLACRLGWSASDLDEAITKKFNEVSMRLDFPERL